MHIGTQGFDVSDGFRRYEVTDRATALALGGLCLPIPGGASCRLILNGGNAGLFLDPMSSNKGGIEGDINQKAFSGLYTVSVSGCQVIGLFTYESGRWTRYFFQHCLAGYYNIDMAAKVISLPESTVGIVAQIGNAGLEGTVDDLVKKVGIPKINIIGYNAGAANSINFGIRLTGGPFGGHFGEID